MAATMKADRITFFAPHHHTKEYREWREKVNDACGGICSITKDSKNLSAHHLNDASNHPDQMYLVENGEMVREDYHMDFHINYMGGYDKKCTKQDWEIYKKIQINKLNQNK